MSYMYADEDEFAHRMLTGDYEYEHLGINRFLVPLFVRPEQTANHLPATFLFTPRGPGHTRGLGVRPRYVPEALMGIAYPRQLVEHHLDLVTLWARVLNIGARPGDGMFGVTQDMGFISTPRYLDERNYPPDGKRLSDSK